MPDYALVRVKNTKEMAPLNEVLVWHRASMLVSQRHLSLVSMLCHRYRL
jgi:hypothetical protein